MKSAIIFIDGNNWYHNSKVILENLGDIDFRKLSKMIYLKFNLELVDIKYYNAVPNCFHRSYVKHMKFINELKANNISVKVKGLSGRGNHVREKGVDVMIALDMVQQVLVDKKCDVCVLVSGDADFIPAMEMIRRGGLDSVSCSVLKGYSKDLRSGEFRHLVLKREDLLRCLK